MDEQQPACSDGTPFAPSFGAWWKGSQMLRISVVRSSSQAVTLQIEGDVKGRWVEELRRSCEEALSRGTQLTLDLAGVSFIDLEGIALFRALLNRRVALTRLSSFTAEQLRDLQP
jgi:ABC-type transporter Mla MlaB component